MKNLFIVLFMLEEYFIHIKKKINTTLMKFLKRKKFKDFCNKLLTIPIKNGFKIT